MVSPLYLLDSNICIYVLADATSAIAAKLTSCAQGSAVTSAIAYAEVIRGSAQANESERAKLRDFFNLVPVLPFDAAAAVALANLPLRRGGFDRLIAAHALSLDLTLVTNNERDFRDVVGLRIENWTGA